MMPIKEQRYLDQLPDLSSKTVLITGASSGIGLEAAKAFAYKGAHVIFFVRDKAKTQTCIEKIESELGHSIQADIILYNQADVSTFEAAVKEAVKYPIDIIVLNAGVYFPKVGQTAYDMDMTLVVNAIGTRLLFERFYEAFPKSRYVFVSSIVAQKAKKHNYDAFLKPLIDHRIYQYNVSKQCVTYAYEYASRCGADCCLYHPGVTRTNILREFTPWFKKAGQAFVTAVTHPAWKASLGILKASLAPIHSYIAPMGLFHISGYPRFIRFHIDFKDYEAYESYIGKAKLKIQESL